MHPLPTALRTILVFSAVTVAACSGHDTPPTAPTPPPGTVTANAYILPGAQALGPNAFGDEPVVIYKGERLRLVNLDTSTHAVVADTVGATDFDTTDELPRLAERSFIMSKLGTTKIHCMIHPEMTGTLVVRER
jgi:plastocyanin